MSIAASIVLCTVDEVENLPVLVKEIEEKVKFYYQLVFEDDGSTDGTREYIMEYAKSHKDVKYFFYQNKRSLLNAEFSGFNHSDGTFILKMDADLQHPVDKLNEIYENLVAGYDIVVASRYIDGGSVGKRDALRGVISRVANFFAKIFLVSARKTTDPLSGFFGFRKGLKSKINEKWRGYKSLLFLLSSNPKARIKDVPYRFSERPNGDSKIVSGFEFIRIYLTELILAKRLEISSRKISP